MTQDPGTQPDALADDADPTIGIDPPEVVMPAVSGRLVDADGVGVPDAKVLCCTMSTCYSANTDEDGNYVVGNLTGGGWKLQLLGGSVGAATFVWYQEVTDMTANHTLDRDVVAVAQTSDPVPWIEATGGTVVSADGELELTADPVLDDNGDRALDEDGDPLEPLEGPIGWDDTIQAVKVPVEHIPPYDVQPWDDGDTVHAFHIDPFKIHGNVPVQLRLLKGPYGEVGDAYTIYEVHLDYGKLQVAGKAIVGDDGVLASDENANLTHLSTVIIVADGGAAADAAAEAAANEEPQEDAAGE